MEEILEPFLCPVLQEKMREPMLCRHCGHSFEQAAVEEVLKRAGRCPLCRTQWQRADLVPNRTLQEAIFQLPLLLAARSPSSKHAAASALVDLKEGQCYIAGQHWGQTDGLQVVLGERLVLKELSYGNNLALVHPVGDPKMTGRVPITILEEQGRPPSSYAEGDICQVVRSFRFDGIGGYLNVQRFEGVRVLHRVEPPEAWVYVESLEVSEREGWVPEAFLSKADRVVQQPPQWTAGTPGEEVQRLLATAQAALRSVEARVLMAAQGQGAAARAPLMFLTRTAGTAQQGAQALRAAMHAMPQQARPAPATQRAGAALNAVAQQGRPAHSTQTAGEAIRAVMNAVAQRGRPAQPAAQEDPVQILQAELEATNPEGLRASHIFQREGAAAAEPQTEEDEGWEYIDPQQQVRGPFTRREMQTWHSMGYFRAELLMRCHRDDRFVPLQALFPPPLVPFRSSPRRPSEALRED